MARDHSPKERGKQQLKRKQGGRASYDRILIVCEGSKTEPNYFKEIRKKYRLPTANVQVLPSQLGTEPSQVVEYARDLFQNGDRYKNIQPGAFEKVYAVFDRDDHKSYHKALASAKSLNGRLKNDNKQPVHFKAIASVPSFELWLLLHYEDIRAPLHRDEVMRRLKNHILGYDKGASDIFAITDERLTCAIERAEALAKRFDAGTEPEPFTAVFELVMLLKPKES